MKPLHRLGTRSLLLLMFAALVLAAGAPPPASADGTPDSPVSALTATEPTTVVGVVAAIACGLGIRYLPVVVAVGPVAIAVEIGSCLLMIIDALAS